MSDSFRNQLFTDNDRERKFARMAQTDHKLQSFTLRNSERAAGQPEKRLAKRIPEHLHIPERKPTQPRSDGFGKCLFRGKIRGERLGAQKNRGFFLTKNLADKRGVPDGAAHSADLDYIRPDAVNHRHSVLSRRFRQNALTL